MAGSFSFHSHSGRHVAHRLIRMRIEILNVIEVRVSIKVLLIHALLFRVLQLASQNVCYVWSFIKEQKLIHNMNLAFLLSASLAAASQRVGFLFNSEIDLPDAIYDTLSLGEKQVSISYVITRLGALVFCYQFRFCALAARYWWWWMGSSWTQWRRKHRGSDSGETSRYLL